MNETVHYAFPTLIFEDYYEDNKKFLEILSKSWEDHFYNGYSNELTNNLDIHLDVRYKDLYCFLSKSIKKYLQALNIADNFDINFVKSWFNILGESTTPLHSHGDAHISIVYYANTPDDMGQFLRFHYFDNERQAFPGLYDYNNSGYNESNSRTYSINTYQGQVVVFSSKIPHDTFGDGKILNAPEEPVKSFYDLNKKRICIASDIILTYKDKINKPLGLQPVYNWRKFDE